MLPEKNIDKMQQRLADKWAGERCYLNGAPAKVCGRLNRFATIAALDSDASAEFAWHTVNAVMNRGRFFET